MAAESTNRKRWMAIATIIAVAVFAVVFFWPKSGPFLKSTALPSLRAAELWNGQAHGRQVPVLLLSPDQEQTSLVSPMVILRADEVSDDSDSEHPSSGFPISFDSAGSQFAVLGEDGQTVYLQPSPNAIVQALTLPETAQEIVFARFPGQPLALYALHHVKKRAFRANVDGSLSPSPAWVSVPWPEIENMLIAQSTYSSTVAEIRSPNVLGEAVQAIPCFGTGDTLLYFVVSQGQQDIRKFSLNGGRWAERGPSIKISRAGPLLASCTDHWLKVAQMDKELENTYVWQTDLR